MTKRVLVLVEGQTEERFVKDILNPFFGGRACSIPTILATKRVKHGPDFKGGVGSFSQFKDHLQRLLPDRSALVTTMVDYYGLPSDFPGMSTRPSGTPEARVSHVESEIASHFNNPGNFLPHLMLHEFEALLFSSENELPGTMLDPGKAAEFSSIRRGFPSPEEINEQPGMSPSHRIKRLFPAYRKTIHGPLAINKIGIDAIRRECRHFDGWLRAMQTWCEG